MFCNKTIKKEREKTGRHVTRIMKLCLWQNSRDMRNGAESDLRKGAQPMWAWSLSLAVERHLTDTLHGQETIRFRVCLKMQ